MGRDRAREQFEQDRRGSSEARRLEAEMRQYMFDKAVRVVSMLRLYVRDDWREDMSIKSIRIKPRADKGDIMVVANGVVNGRAKVAFASGQDAAEALREALEKWRQGDKSLSDDKYHMAGPDGELMYIKPDDHG